MDGGSITGNTCNDDGGGIIYYYGSEEATLGDTAKITGNTAGSTAKSANNFYLPLNTWFHLGTQTAQTEGNSVKVPAEGMNIGISSKRLPTGDQTKTIAANTDSTVEGAKHFSSDKIGYKVVAGSYRSLMLQAIQYNITYKDQGDAAFSGTHESGYPTVHTFGTATALKGASKTGYTFGGWFSTPDCKGDAVTTLGATDYTEDITLYAKWKNALPTGLSYTDVAKSAWYYNDVYYVWENSLMVGTADTLFSPNLDTTRGMIATIIWRLEGEPSVNYAMSFKDVEPGKWYTEAIRWAQANGIVKGYSAEAFGPNDTVTREQFAAIMYRYAQYKNYDVSAKGDLSNFTDKDNIGKWALESVTWAKGADLISGVSATKLAPKNLTTRAQVAAILHRFCEYFNN